MFRLSYYVNIKDWQHLYATNISSSRKLRVTTPHVVIPKCTSCQKLTYPVLKACINRHVYCLNCTVEACRICQVLLAATDAREMSYEIINDQKFYLCWFENNGCNALGQREVMEYHEWFCPFGKIACPFKRCQWDGTSKHLFSHVQNEHEISSNMARNGTGTDTFFVNKYTQKIFRFTIGRDATSRSLKVFVVYVGSEEEASKYSCTVTLHSMDRRDKLTSSHLCKPLSYENTNSNADKHHDLQGQPLCNYVHRSKYKVDVDVFPTAYWRNYVKEN